MSKEEAEFLVEELLNAYYDDFIGYRTNWQELRDRVVVELTKKTS